MSYFNKYPYYNITDLNLDYILTKIAEQATELANFVTLNAIKYANPIQWDIATQYEANTVVIDPNTGTAYISTQPVPSGVALSNTDYWTVIFNLGEIISDAAKNFTDNYEESTTTTATAAYSANDWIIWGNTLYRALTNITAGDAFTIGSNIEQFSIEDIVGHIEDLTTTDDSNVVAAINELDSDLGTLENTVSNMQPVLEQLDNICDSFNWVNVLYPPDDGDLPLVADWTSPSSYTDNTARFQALITKYGSGTTFYFPAGVYGFSNAITIPYNQIRIIGNATKYTRLHINSSTITNFISLGSETAMNGLLRVEHIGFICDDVTGAVNAIKLNNPRTCYFDDILFVDFYNDIFYDAIVASSGQTSIFRWLNHSVTNRTTMNRMFYFNRASNSIFPNGIIIENCHGSFLSYGRFIEGYAADIWITHCNIAYCVNAIWLTAGNENISGDVHINNNVFADSVGHVMYLRHYNRGVVISDNMIEQQANYTSVLAAVRLMNSNGVIIANNTVGTERTSITNHHIGLLLTEGTLCKDILINNNVCYLGAYILLTSGATQDVIIANNFFAHVGNNTTQANAFYIALLSTSNVHDNRFKEFAALCSAYSISNFFDSNNIYESSTTVNSPFTAANNHVI